MSSAPEWLATLTDHAMARIFEIIREIPGGSDEERGAVATAIISEIMARSLALPEAAQVAEIANNVLAAHKLAWRLVPMSWNTDEQHRPQRARQTDRAVPLHYRRLAGAGWPDRARLPLGLRHSRRL
jgi:hypothetical protein